MFCLTVVESATLSGAAVEVVIDSSACFSECVIFAQICNLLQSCGTSAYTGPQYPGTPTVNESTGLAKASR